MPHMKAKSRKKESKVSSRGRGKPTTFICEKGWIKISHQGTRNRKVLKTIIQRKGGDGKVWPGVQILGEDCRNRGGKKA